MINFLISFIRKIFRINHCAYMYFPMNLPEPLDEELEGKLLDLVALKDLNARNTLIEHNLRLVVYIAKRFESPKVLLEDLISIGSMGLIKGIETFKKDKNIKLATYCSRCIENEILMTLRSNKNKKNYVYLFESVGEDKEGNPIELIDLIKDKQEDILDQMEHNYKINELRKALNILNSRELEIIELRYGLNGKKSYTQKEIAKSMNISRSYVSRIEKRALMRLYLYITQNGKKD